MSFTLEAKCADVPQPEFPNGFWPALMVETPLAKRFGCSYASSDKNMVKFDHLGYVGDWYSLNEAIQILETLLVFVETEEYRNHRYFATRDSQMQQFISFVAASEGFRKVE